MKHLSIYKIYNILYITISDQSTFASKETNKAGNGGIDQVVNDSGEDFLIETNILIDIFLMELLWFL